MGKKKNKNGGGGGGGNQNQNQNPNGNGGGGGEAKQEVKEEVAVEKSAGGGGDGGEKKTQKQEKGLLTVVLKVEMHCEGCASKIIKLTRGFEGVESVKAEFESNKLTVIGNVDPVLIRDKLHEKTRKKIELISPQPKKDDGKNDAGKGKSDDGGKKPAADGEQQKKQDAGEQQKKPKETPVTTAVLKLGFHCQGCIEKIKKVVSKTKGVHEIVAMDKAKETVTVKGTMDVNALAGALKERLKRPVEIVPPPKKEKGGDGAGGDDKGKEKEVQQNGNNGGGGKKKNGGGGGGNGEGGGNGGQGQGQDNGNGGGGMEVSRMEYMVQPGYGPPGFAPNGFMGHPVYGNGYMGPPVYGNNGYVGQPVYEYGYGYGYGQVPGYPVHMKFNDENPNSCSVM